MSKISPLLLLAAFPFVQAAAGQMPSGLPTEQDYFADLPLVLSATRLSQRLDESPVAVTVIDRQMIEASGARELQEILRLAPGMIVGYDNGHDAFVTHHAMADRYARRMQVLIDGQSVYSPIFGGVDWSAVSLAIEDIERIEVIRGPSAAAYGANAFLGTISITTRAPTRDDVVRARLEAGNDGIYKTLAGIEDQSGRLGYRLTASRWADDGFEPLNGREDGKTVSLVTGRFDYSADPDTRWIFQIGANREDARSGQAATSIFEPPHDEITRRNFQQLRWERSLNATNNLSIQFYRAAEDTQETFDTLPIPLLGGLTAQIDRDIRSERYDLELQHTLSLQNDVRVVWGASTRLDRVQSLSYFMSPDWIENNLYRLFGHTEWRISEQWLANAGLMLEHSDISGNDASPRLALNYRLDAAHTFRGSISRAVRTPVILEDMANQRFSAGPVFDQVFFATGDLNPERITAYEIGYLGRYLNDTLTADMRLFYDKITDIITYYQPPYPDPFNGVAYDFRNLDYADISGYETQLNYHPAYDRRLVFNYAYTRIESDDMDEIYSQSGPRHNASLLGITHLYGDISGSLGFYYMSDYHGLDTGDPIPVTRRLDLRFAMPLEISRHNVEVSLTLQSVLGTYRDFRDENIADTRAYLGITGEF